MFIILLIIFLASLLFCGNSHQGIDVSQLFSVANYTCAKNNGVTFGIPRGYCSFGGMDKNVVTTLKHMREAGLHTDTYMFPCRGKSAVSQVHEMISNIPENLYERIWLDIETNPSPGCSWNGHSGTSNCDFLIELVKEIKAKGKPVGIYASKYMWSSIFGSNSACAHAAH